MKKTLSNVAAANKQKFMLKAEAAILDKRPDLKGKFSTLRIWETLQYFYTCNGMDALAAARRVLDQYPPKEQETKHADFIKTTPEKGPAPMKYTYYEDPGHGWIKVNRQELHDLNIAHKISKYSYVKNEYVYLEEDQDAGYFFEAYTAKHGQRPELNEVYQERTPIRNYERYETPEEPAPHYDMVPGEGAPQYTFDTPKDSQLSLF